VHVVAIDQLMIFIGQRVDELFDGSAEPRHFSALPVDGGDVRAERLDMNIYYRVNTARGSGHPGKRADFFLELRGSAVRVPQTQLFRNFQVHLDEQPPVELVRGYFVHGKPAPRGGQFPLLTLPSNIESLGDSFQSYDVRLSKEFNIIAERLKLELIGEVYNLFNISNKRGYSGSLDAGFAQPTSKANPNFGLGGPRIFQIGGRIKF